ncbi:MAG: carboxypeptidase-like regulatory domain-containing protein [Acidobacteriota bacterium]
MSTFTDDDGCFTTDGLEPGAYDILVRGQVCRARAKCDYPAAHSATWLAHGGNRGVRVVDRHGRGVEGATVVVVASGSRSERDWEPHGASAPTDRKGEALLDAVPESRSLWINIDHPLYLPFKETLTVAHAQGEKRPWIDVVMDMGATLAGRVLDATTNEPVSGAFVNTAHGSDYRGRWGIAVTGADGAFRCTGIEQGSVCVMVNAEGYIDARPKVDVPAEGRSDVEIRLSRGATFTGTVRDRRGSPVQGATVYVEPLNSITRGRGLTDGNGTFRVSGLDRSGMDKRGDAPLRVGVKAEGYQWFSETTKESEIDIVLDEGAALTGRVVDADSGDGIPAASVYIFDKGQSPPDSPVATADGHGRFRLTGIAPGTYATRARAPEYPAENGPEIEVQLGRDAGEVVIEISRGRTLSGVVLDGELGEPVPGARIEIEELETEVKSDELGRFQVTGLYGRWTSVTVRHPRYGIRVIKEVSLDSESPVVLLLTRGGRIEGAVTRGGKPARGAAVSVENVTTRSAPDGTFSLDGVAPGVVMLSVMSDGAPHVEREVEVASGKATHVSIEVEQGTRIEGQVHSGGLPMTYGSVNVEAGPWWVIGVDVGAEGRFSVPGVPPGRALIAWSGKATTRSGIVTFEAPIEVPDQHVFPLTLEVGSGVRGKVVDDAGDPVAGCHLRIGEDLIESHSAHANANGLFEMEAVPPGDYLLVAETYDRSFPPSGTRVHVEAGRWTEGVVVTLAKQPSQLIAGRILHADGRPAYRAEVSLSDSSVHEYSAFTDVEGGFVIEGVPEGHYRLVASKTGFGVAWIEDFPVEPDTPRVELTLPRLAALRVTVHRGTEPVAGAHVHLSYDAWPQHPNTRYRSEETDSQGVTYIEVLPTGALTVQVTTAVDRRVIPVMLRPDEVTELDVDLSVRGR